MDSNPCMQGMLNPEGPNTSVMRALGRLDQVLVLNALGPFGQHLSGSCAVGIP